MAPSLMVEQFLDEIQENANDEPGRREVQININEIRPNPYQPRKEFDEKGLQELADSIKEHGIFTPLLVRKSVMGYDLITGERRLRAAKMAGLDKVPAIQVDFDDSEMMEIALLENVQRENLNPIEEALGYEALVKKLGYTQEKLAERVGKSREYCANMMRLLKLPDSIKDLVVAKKLTMGHVRPLLSLKDEDAMEDAADEILKKEKEKDPYTRDLETRMSDKYGTRVEIGRHDIRISFSDTDDLNRLLEMLGCLDESEQD